MANYEHIPSIFLHPLQNGTTNWEIDRIGNKTKVMCPIVQLHRKLFITCWRNFHRWLETYFGKLTATIRCFQHCPDRGILTINDNDSQRLLLPHKNANISNPTDRTERRDRVMSMS
jgi:hypothetical protein